MTSSVTNHARPGVYSVYEASAVVTGGFAGESGGGGPEPGGHPWEPYIPWAATTKLWRPLARRMG